MRHPQFMGRALQRSRKSVHRALTDEQKAAQAYVQSVRGRGIELLKKGYFEKRFTAAEIDELFDYA